MRRELIFCIALMTALPGTVAALDTDLQQPLQIEADKFQLDRTTGVSTYTGNVSLRRGSLRLHAAKLTLHQQGKRVSRLVATGSPASLTQQATTSGQTITATAGEMVYETASGLITLSQDAQLLQDDNRFASERIVYDTIKARVTAGDSGAGQRVQITIQPDQVNSETLLPAQPDASAP